MSLTSPLYYEAVHARANGDEAKARALELAQFDQRHYTPADFMCRGLAKLRHGDWTGWLDFERRFEEPSYRKEFGRIRIMESHEPWFRFASDAYGNWTQRDGWEAELQEMTILVGPEGGAGDMIMLSRFLPWLARRAKRVYWLVPVDMLRLRELADFEVDVIAQEELPAFDRYVMMFSLPAIAGEMLPPGDMYNPSSYRYLTRPLVHGGAIGLCWSGSEAYHNNAIRSMTEPDWFRLMCALAEANVEPGYISYQRGPAQLYWPREQHQAERSTGDWADTYRSLAMECRALVTVDTGIAHLAGAMNIPTFTLLAADSCWRWGPETTDGRSIWYPSMRLIKQRQPGDWSYPIHRVVSLLRSEI